MPGTPRRVLRSSFGGNGCSHSNVPSATSIASDRIAVLLDSEVRTTDRSAVSSCSAFGKRCISSPFLGVTRFRSTRFHQFLRECPSKADGNHLPQNCGEH